MTVTGQRLLFTGILAMGLHIVLLFLRLDQGQVFQPKAKPVQGIAVSLKMIQTAKKVPQEPRQERNLEKREVVQSLPDKKPKQVFSKRLAESDPEPEIEGVIPVHAEQSFVRPLPTLQETPGEDQADPELSAPSSPKAPESENISEKSSTAQVIQQISPLYQVNPPPQYPRRARRQGLEGVVLLEALVDASGRVTDLRLFTSSGHFVLDRAALKAVRHWRFTPGRTGGNRQEMWVKVPIRFQLK